jgi:2,7-dihydroxy-5-methyl-1-naphthoate 7-O-methyltransferase
MELWELADLATPWCVHVAATLRVADHIEAGAQDIGTLAAACGADRDALARVLRQLVIAGVFEEPSAGRFTLNDAARGLLGDGVLGFDLEGFGGRMAYAWSKLLPAVRTGRPAYHEIFGRAYWDDLEANPAIAEQFDRLMGPAGHGYPDPQVLVNPEDWKDVRTVVDIGGGTGTLLAAVLRSQPGARGVLVDLPRTVARSAATFEAAGVADRVTVSGQSFFDPLPGGADLYMLKSVIVDWPDREAAEILRRCGEAARPHGRVVIVNGVNPGESAAPDLLMLVLVGGKERTLAEFRELARGAALDVSASGRQPSGRFVVECRPV